MYKVSWKKSDGWYAIKAKTKADMLMEVADKILISDQVKVKVIGE